MVKKQQQEWINVNEEGIDQLQRVVCKSTEKVVILQIKELKKTKKVNGINKKKQKK